MAVVLTIGTGRAAYACPVCDGETGKAVREELVDEHLTSSLLATLLPFAAVMGMIGIIHMMPRRPGGGS